MATSLATFVVDFDTEIHTGYGSEVYISSSEFLSSAC